MPSDARFQAVPLALLLVGCAPIPFDGSWVGVCDTPGLGLRVQLTVWDAEEEEPWVTGVVHRPDRRGVPLLLDCRALERSGDEVSVGACTGSWEGTGGAHDFDVSGTLEEGEYVPVLEGDCTIDGLDGDLELWRLP